ncbi:hypothetical protein OE810_00990 [Rhodobacteraceae bacterium XHP0102]|nr:hypothetical protein [Rhodobacteraceae bacterium XHP0102]
MPLAITDFDFDKHSADPDALISAWVPEIEEAAHQYVPDDKFIAFLVAALRLGARSKSLEGLNVMRLIEKAGYSRSTFFRLFEGHTSFLLKGYQLTCQLSTQVYAKHLADQPRSLNEFCTFTADVFYGANCTIPHEILQMLWKEHNLTHQEFHPHLDGLTSIIADFLAKNAQTKDLSIDRAELSGVIQSLDLDILTARLEDNPDWGTPLYYKKLRRLLHGYLLTLTE